MIAVRASYAAQHPKALEKTSYSYLSGVGGDIGLEDGSGFHSNARCCTRSSHGQTLTHHGGALGGHRGVDKGRDHSDCGRVGSSRKKEPCKVKLGEKVLIMNRMMTMCVVGNRL